MLHNAGDAKKTPSQTLQYLQNNVTPLLDIFSDH